MSSPWAGSKCQAIGEGQRVGPGRFSVKQNPAWLEKESRKRLVSQAVSGRVEGQAKDQAKWGETETACVGGGSG